MPESVPRALIAAALALPDPQHAEEQPEAGGRVGKEHDISLRVSLWSGQRRTGFIQHGAKLPAEDRNMALRDVPDDVDPDIVVVMNDAVSRAHDQRRVRKGAFETAVRLNRPCQGLADDRERALDGQLKDAIRTKGCRRFACDQRRDFFGGAHGVMQPLRGLDLHGKAAPLQH